MRPCSVALAATLLGALAALPDAVLADPQGGCLRSESVSLPAERFRDNGDGTVTDTTSKLMWMRCSTGQRWQSGACVGAAGSMSWPEAQGHADQVNLDGRASFSDWRLPSVRELATITARECVRPRTNAAVFPGTAPAAYWSATPRAGETSGERVFALGFGAQGVFAARKDERHHLRLVRSGP